MRFKALVIAALLTVAVSFASVSVSAKTPTRHRALRSKLSLKKRIGFIMQPIRYSKKPDGTLKLRQTFVKKGQVNLSRSLTQKPNGTQVLLERYAVTHGKVSYPAVLKRVTKPDGSATVALTMKGFKTLRWKEQGRYSKLTPLKGKTTSILRSRPAAGGLMALGAALYGVGAAATLKGIAISSALSGGFGAAMLSTTPSNVKLADIVPQSVLVSNPPTLKR